MDPPKYEDCPPLPPSYESVIAESGGSFSLGQNPFLVHLPHQSSSTSPFPYSDEPVMNNATGSTQTSQAKERIAHIDLLPMPPAYTVHAHQHYHQERSSNHTFSSRELNRPEFVDIPTHRSAESTGNNNTNDNSGPNNTQSANTSTKDRLQNFFKEYSKSPSRQKR